MKALILAAGRGTRVRPLTDALPKPMIPVVNRPVMAFLVDHLRRNGVGQIMVNTSYLSPQIEAYFRDGLQFDVEMAYSFEGREQDGRLIDEPLGSAGAIQKIHRHSGFFDETFVVLCGDALVDLDLRELLRFHRRHGGLATIALREVAPEAVSQYGIVVHDADGRIVQFQEKPSAAAALSRLANTGIYIFEPGVLAHIPADRPFDIGGELFPRLAAEGQLYGTTMSYDWQWLDIGRIEDFHAVTMQALRGQIDGFCMPGREVRPDVWAGMNVRANFDRITLTGPVFIGGSAEIEDGARLIGPVCIGAGAVVEAGAHVEASIVLEHTRVGTGAYVRDRIVGPRFCASADGTVLDGRHTDTAWLFADARNRDFARSAEQADLLTLIRRAA
jgi:mannose-1-phosphate guanylyltransferase